MKRSRISIAALLLSCLQILTGCPKDDPVVDKVTPVISSVSIKDGSTIGISTGTLTIIWSVPVIVSTASGITLNGSTVTAKVQNKSMRLTAHEDGWIYGVFCVERKDPDADPDDLSSAVACAGIARTKDLDTWERLPDLVSKSQQRNVVLHPEFIDGNYALYTRPQDGFIDAGSGGGICWTLVKDITHAKVGKETLIDPRHYHTIKECKNGEGPAPIRTSRGWLHLAHGVRNCAAGLRYVLYLYITSLDEPWNSPIAASRASFELTMEPLSMLADDEEAAPAAADSKRSATTRAYSERP